MNTKTIQEVKAIILKSGKNWQIPFMEFVDDLRRTRDMSLIEKPFSLSDDKIDSLLASTIE